MSIDPNELIKANREVLAKALGRYGRTLASLPLSDNKFSGAILLVLAGAVASGMVEDLSTSMQDWVTRKMAVLETRIAADEAFKV